MSKAYHLIKKINLLGWMHKDRVLLSVFHAEYFVVVGQLCLFKIAPTISEKYQIKEQTHNKNPNKQRCIEQLRWSNIPAKLNI